MSVCFQFLCKHLADVDSLFTTTAAGAHCLTQLNTDPYHPNELISFTSVQMLGFTGNTFSLGLDLVPRGQT